MHWPGLNMTKITTHKPDFTVSILRDTASGVHPSPATYLMKVLKNRTYGSSSAFYINNSWTRVVGNKSGREDWVTLNVVTRHMDWITEQDSALYEVTPSESDSVFAWYKEVHMSNALFTLFALRWT